MAKGPACSNDCQTNRVQCEPMAVRTNHPERPALRVPLSVNYHGNWRA